MRKKLWIPILVALLAMPMVMATTLNVPVKNGNYSGTVLLNATTALTNADNATFYYNSSGGVANATYGTKATTIQNDTSGDTEFTGSFDISGLSDATTYNWSVIVTNTTGSTESDSTKPVTIDNTNPSITITLSSTDKNIRRDVKYTTSISDATSGVETSDCNVTDPQSTETSISTSASETLYTPDLTGDHDFTCSATDYAGNSDSSTTTLTVSDAGRQITIEEEEEGGFLAGMSDKTIGLILVVGAIVLWLVLKEK